MKLEQLIAEHSSAPWSGGAICYCGEEFTSFEEWAAHLALVIRNHLGRQIHDLAMAMCKDEHMEWDSWASGAYKHRASFVVRFLGGADAQDGA